MYIAKYDGVITMAQPTEDELRKALVCKIYDTIEETGINYILYNGEYVTEEEYAQRERERIAKLNLTAADVERAIYKAKGIDFNDVITRVETVKSEEIDIKALKIELRANNFYRGNPYIEKVGELLGFTSKQLDEFFETNDYTKLLAAETDENIQQPNET